MFACAPAGRSTSWSAATLLVAVLLVAACGSVVTPSETVPKPPQPSPAAADHPAAVPSATPAPLSARRMGDVPMDPCSPDGHAALCGTVYVPADPANEAGAKLGLWTAVYPATGASPKPDPIFFLAGGPGGSAVSSYGYALKAFSELNRDHDFVLVDQRGTGEHGAVPLPGAPDLSALSEADQLAKLRAWIPSALATLDIDPRLYTSWIAADDLDRVRAALGYDQVNLFGGSYGATMAQVYLAAHPEHVRTATMTGVSLLDVHLFEHAAVAAQEALDKVLARCDADTACHRAYPAIHEDLATALATAKAGPITARVTNPDTGRPVMFDEARFGATILQLTTSVELAAEVPRAIHRAAVGDWDVLARLAVDQSVFAQASLPIMALTIRCSEGWATWDPAVTARQSAGSYEAAQVNALARLNAAICSAWPKAPVPAADAQPVRSDKPVLLLVGGADPADPPENVSDAPTELPNSVAAIFPAGGHCVETYGCAPRVMTEFIEAGTAKGLDVSCAADAPLPAFNTLP